MIKISKNLDFSGVKNEIISPMVPERNRAYGFWKRWLPF